MHEHRCFPFEKIAKLDSPERRERLPPEPLVELIAGYAPRAVVDIGVGTGYFALPLAARLPEVRIYGLDVEPRMLEVLGERAGEVGCSAAIESVVSPADSIALPDDAVDVALMAAVYHELPNRSAYLEEVSRVLRPGGHAVICDWRHDRSFEHGPPEHHRVACAVAEAELEAAGFAEVGAKELYEAFYVLTSLVR